MSEEEQKILCPICGEPVKKKGIGTHKRKAHGITKKSQKSFLDQVLSSFGDLIPEVKTKRK